MTKKYWISGAPEIAQVITLTIAGTAANGNTYTVEMGVNNTKTVTYTATALDTNTTITTALYNLLAASTYPEFQEETYANPTATTITVTSAQAGRPFTLSTAVTGSGTLGQSTTVANSGPNDVDIAANWSTNSLPTTGDDIYIINNTNSLLYNLQALSAVVLNSLTWDTTFTGQAGLPINNPNGYEEYRQINFQIQSPTETFLAGQGGGSSLIQRDNGATNWTVQVNATGSPLVQGRPALLLKGSGTNTLTVTRGQVGSAIDPGDTASWNLINVGWQQSQKTDVNLQLGAGATVTTIDQTGGQLFVYCSVTTWTLWAGSGTIYGAGTITTLDVEGTNQSSATVSYQSSGTITTLTIGINGSVDFRNDPRSRTVTNATCYGPFYDPSKSVTFTNPVSFPIGIPANIQMGTEIHLARS